MKKKCTYCYNLGYTGLVYDTKTDKIIKAICPKCHDAGYIIPIVVPIFQIKNLIEE